MDGRHPLADFGETSTAEKVAIGLLIGAGVLGAAGGIYYVVARRRRTSGTAGMFGRAQLQQQVTAGGMTLKRYDDKAMPIQERIRILQGLVFDSVHDPRMRQLALGSTYNCPERDGTCEAQAVYNTIKGRVRYTGDVAEIKHPNGAVEGIDLYQSAWRTWEFAGGDCDDHAVLSATWLTLNGITSRFRVTAPRPGQEYSHIYTVAGLPKNKPTKWVAVDTTLPGSNKFGVEAPWGRAGEAPAIKDAPV